MSRGFAPLAALIALAGCGQTGVAATDADTGRDAVAAGASDTPSQSNVSSDSSDIAASTPPFAETRGAHRTAPEPAPIPARFRGTFAADAAACADLAHPSRLTISGRTVRFPEYVIFGDSFSFPTPAQFAMKGKIEATGAPAEAHYSIDVAGMSLTDEAGGGTVRVRCS